MSRSHAHAGTLAVYELQRVIQTAPRHCGDVQYYLCCLSPGNRLESVNGTVAFPAGFSLPTVSADPTKQNDKKASDGIGGVMLAWNRQQNT